MNVRELKELLDGYPDDMEVCIEQPTHNHWRQIVASPIKEEASVEAAVKYSEYNSADTVDKDWSPYDDDELPEGHRKVLLLA